MLAMADISEDTLVINGAVRYRVSVLVGCRFGCCWQQEQDVACANRFGCDKEIVPLTVCGYVDVITFAATNGKHLCRTSYFPGLSQVKS